MTIRHHINARALRDQLSNLDACAEEAPEGTYTDVKAVSQLVKDTVDNLMAGMASLGMKANNADPIEEVAAVIYGYIRDSNPEAYGLAAGEGFGNTMLTGSKELVARVKGQAASNLAFLQSRGVV